MCVCVCVCVCVRVSAAVSQFHPRPIFKGKLKASAEKVNRKDKNIEIVVNTLLPVHLITSSLYYKNILMIISDDRKLRLYYKCFISPSLSLSDVSYDHT